MIATLDRAATRAEARAFFGLDPDRPTLMVTGGSQGAQSLNRSVSGAAAALAAAGVQVLHVQGKHGGAEPGPVPPGAPPYVVLDFCDRMDLALAAADLTICRAGANSVVEAAATGLPAVFVPLPIGNGEQRRNAAPVVEAGGALLVEDADLTSEWVVDHAVPLVTDPARLAAMGAAAGALVPRDADEALARIVLEVGGAGR